MELTKKLNIENVRAYIKDEHEARLFMFKYNKLRKEYLNDTLKLLKNAGVNCNDMAKILDIPLTSVINNEEVSQWRKEAKDD